MCTGDRVNELRFTHFVVGTYDRITLAVAREGEKIRNFILGAGWVKQQVNSHFEYLPTETAIAVRQRAEQYLDKVPIYRTKTLAIN
ncbi:MAG: hypothetical protein JRI56_09665 [Deltaproteobacteria bacterium]|nr:hypothetical protein [Deltaproteobacteria bacterium]